MFTALALTIASAVAWEHEGYIWPPTDDVNSTNIPEYRVLSDRTDCDALGCVARAQAAHDVWVEAPCVVVEPVFAGSELGAPLAASPGRRSVVFGDSALEPGLVSMTTSEVGEISYLKGGRVYKQLLDHDIYLYDDVLSSPGIVDWVLAHDVGHALGLAHTCAWGEPCATPDALMNLTVNPTVPRSPALIGDDIEGLQALYGPSIAVQCDGLLDADQPGLGSYAAVGALIRCEVAPAADGEAEWAFGDGAQSTGALVQHSYDQPGVYQITASVPPLDDTCAASTYQATHRALVCDAPTATFTAAPTDGLTWQLRNETEVSVSGCVTDVQWDISRDGASEPFATLTAWEPTFTFPEPGIYRVLLHVAGPEGTTAAELTIDVSAGCACQTGFGGASWLSLVALVTLARRRGA